MEIEDWNRMYPIGTHVRYFPIKGLLDEYEDFDTRSEAFMSEAGYPVIFLKGKSGYVCLDHITPLEEPVINRSARVSPRINHSCPGDTLRHRAAAACRGNKWAEENCRAVGNWPS